MSTICEIRSFAISSRRALEPGLDCDEAGRVISAGSCLYASVLLAELIRKFGVAEVVIRGGSGQGELGARDVEGAWHGHYWLDVVTPDGNQLVVDITADQFGHEPVRVLPLMNSADYRPGDQAEVDAAVQLVRAELELT